MGDTHNRLGSNDLATRPRISSKQFHRLTDLAGQDDAQRTYESMKAFESYADEISWPFRATAEQSEYWAELAKNWGRT